MKERVRWTEYEGKRVLICDFNNLSGEEFSHWLGRTESLLREEIRNKPPVVRQAIDITNSTTDREITKRAKAIAAEVKAATKLRVALIGISGLTRIIANAILHDIHFVRNGREAMAYLAIE